MRNEEAWLVSSYVFYKLLWIKGAKCIGSQTDMLCMNKQFERYETAYRNIIQIFLMEKFVAYSKVRQKDWKQSIHIQLRCKRQQRARICQDS